MIALAPGEGKQRRSLTCPHVHRFHYVPDFVLLERVPGCSWTIACLADIKQAPGPVRTIYLLCLCPVISMHVLRVRDS